MKPEQDMARLEACLEEAQTVVRWPDERLYLRNDQISAWSPAQHLDHLARVLERVFRTIDVLLEDEDPRILHSGRPHFAARMLLLTGWIPRGRGRAPEEVLPEPRPVRHRVRELLERVTAEARAHSTRGDALQEAGGRLPHPLLGAFNAAEWARFAFVHTRHHLAILGEVDRRRGAGQGVDAPELEGEGGCEAPARVP
jgi:hypothetical protein